MLCFNLSNGSVPQRHDTVTEDRQTFPCSAWISSQSRLDEQAQRAAQQSNKTKPETYGRVGHVERPARDSGICGQEKYRQRNHTSTRTGLPSPELESLCQARFTKEGASGCLRQRSKWGRSANCVVHECRLTHSRCTGSQALRETDSQKARDRAFPKEARILPGGGAHVQQRLLCDVSLAARPRAARHA